MQTENYGQGKWWLCAAASSYQDKVRYVTSVGNFSGTSAYCPNPFYGIRPVLTLRF